MDERLRELEREFKTGDLSRAALFAAELNRLRPQLHRLDAAFLRSMSTKPGVAIARAARFVRYQVESTTKLAEKLGTRAWGYRFSKIRKERIRTGGRWRFPGETQLVEIPPSVEDPGERCVIAVYADAKLGIFAVGVKVALGRESVRHCWPEWKGVTRAERKPEILDRLLRWALDTDATDRGLFVLDKKVLAEVENFFSFSATRGNGRAPTDPK